MFASSSFKLASWLWCVCVCAPLSSSQAVFFLFFFWTTDGQITSAAVCPDRDILRVGVTLAGHQKKILNSVQMMRAQMNQIQSVEVWPSHHRRGEASWNARGWRTGFLYIYKKGLVLLPSAHFPASSPSPAPPTVSILSDRNWKVGINTFYNLPPILFCLQNLFFFFISLF